ncbi:MAG: sigma 54-interacting transcriptional regulator [Kofleriaceae bacterium]|nr:sigma 54-interacting transcriptional regulator [Kofleriaceae bacterium]MCL4225792.1 sigma 54-interacting transcriptional regulator [Myxococcales bacterium]
MSSSVLRLVVVDGPDVGVVFEVAATGGTLGRGREHAFRLTDPSVSRAHARLVVRGGEVVLEHLGGRNPTLVAGEVVSSRPLTSGDVIELGDTRLAAVGDHRLAVVDAPPTRVTIERPITALQDRAAPGVLARIGDLLFAAPHAEGLATEASEHLAALWEAEHVALVTLAGGQPVELGASSRAGVRVVPRLMLDRVMDGGAAVGFEHGGRHHLCAPLAPRGAAARAAGLVHAVRAPARPWSEPELTVAVAAARLLGAGIAARAGWDVAERRTRALEERIGAPQILGDSAAAAAMRTFVAKAGPTDATVLLTGESGTGKELVAAALHAASPRAGGPLVAVNCATLGEALVDSELFGHERGAFTGAAERKPGRFELADGGTLFLDEIAELPPRSQAKLLRVLEDRRVERVGGTRPIEVDVRIVAATNRDLGAMVRAGEFRDDLFYRLAVVRLQLAPLRERVEDIVPLAERFVATTRVGRRRVSGFTPDAIAVLRRHPWPGNVRELRNAIERALVLGEGEALTSTDVLPPTLDVAAAARPVRSLRDAEREAIADAMASTGGNKARAAAVLGVDRTTLYKKLRDYGLEAGPAT